MKANVQEFFEKYTEFWRKHPYWYFVFLPVLFGVALFIAETDFFKFSGGSWVSLSLVAALYLVEKFHEYIGKLEFHRKEERIRELEALPDEREKLINDCKKRLQAHTALLVSVNALVQQKFHAVQEAQRYRTTKAMLKAVGKEFAYQKRVNSIMRSLHRFLERYALIKLHGVQGVQFRVCLYTEDNGRFIAHSPIETDESGRLASESGKLLSDADGSVAGYLWHSASDTAISIPDTARAEKRGYCNFRYFSAKQHEYLKSIFCFRIDAPDTKKRQAIISIDTNVSGFFPERVSESMKKDQAMLSEFHFLRTAFTAFATRLSYDSRFDALAKRAVNYMNDLSRN